MNTDYFKSFKYEAKLLRYLIAKGVLGNAALSVLLKYLSNFWKSLQMLLINCNMELKFIRKTHCVLAANGNDNTDANPNDIIFTSKHTKLYVSVVTL